MDKRDYLQPINITSTKKILEQMIKCVCKIRVNNIMIGTGFFCRVNSMNFLMTCYHIIDEKYLMENEEINLSLNNDEENKKIDLGIQREFYFHKEYGTTFIELKEEDKIKNYLELDDNLFKDNEREYYENKSIYILQYLYGKEIYVSYGTLKTISNNKIIHLCSTDIGSSGSPILNLTNNKVIGIHINSNIYHKFNYGTLLKFPLNDLRRKGFKIIKKLGQGGFRNVYKIFLHLEKNHNI